MVAAAAAARYRVWVLRAVRDIRGMLIFGRELLRAFLCLTMRVIFSGRRGVRHVIGRIQGIPRCVVSAVFDDGVLREACHFKVLLLSIKLDYSRLA